MQDSKKIVRVNMTNALLQKEEPEAEGENIQKIVEKLEASDPDLQERFEALGKILDKETEGDNTYAKEVKAVSEKILYDIRRGQNKENKIMENKENKKTKE